MLTKYDLQLIAIVIGNRALDIEEIIAKTDYKSDAVKQDDIEYARRLHELSGKAETLSYRTL